MLQPRGTGVQGGGAASGGAPGYGRQQAAQQNHGELQSGSSNLPSKERARSRRSCESMSQHGMLHPSDNDSLQTSK